MSDLKPMLLNVCAPCRATDGPRLMCAEPGCAFSDYENGDPARPARTREEMVEAGALEVARAFGYEHVFEPGAYDETYDAGYWLHVFEQGLLGAGVIEPREQGDGSHDLAPAGACGQTFSRGGERYMCLRDSDHCPPCGQGEQVDNGK